MRKFKETPFDDPELEAQWQKLARASRKLKKLGVRLSD